MKKKVTATCMPASVDKTPFAGKLQLGEGRQECHKFKASQGYKTRHYLKKHTPPEVKTVTTTQLRQARASIIHSQALLGVPSFSSRLTIPYVSTRWSVHVVHKKTTPYTSLQQQHWEMARKSKMKTEWESFHMKPKQSAAQSLTRRTTSTVSISSC